MKRVSWRLMLPMLCLLLFSVNIAAQSKQLAHHLDVKQANKVLTNYSKAFSEENLTAIGLQNAIRRLDNYRNKASACVESAETNLSELKKIISPQQQTALDSTVAISAEYKYLKDREQYFKKKMVDCRVFVFRADETVNNFTESIQKITTARLLQRDIDIFEIVQSYSSLFTQIFSEFDGKAFLEKGGVYVFSWEKIIVLFLLFGIVIFLSYKIKPRLKVFSEEKGSTTLHEIMRTFSSVIHHYFLVSTLFISFSLYMTVISIGRHELYLLTEFSYAALLFLAYLIGIHFAFEPQRRMWSLTEIPTVIKKSLLNRLRMLGLLSFVTFTFYLIFSTQNLSQDVIHFSETLLVTFLGINVMSILWVVNRFPFLSARHQLMHGMFNVISTLILIVIIGAEWLGYHNFSIYVLRSIILTILVAFSAWLMQKFMSYSLSNVTSDEYVWQKFFRKQLGLRKNENLSEMLWVKFALTITIWGGFLIVVLMIWDFPAIDLRNFIDAIVDGFQVTGATVYPLRILMAFLLFAFLAIMSRWVRNVILTKRTGIEHSARHAMAAIIGYVGFSVAILLSVLIAGVNFTGLAIVAGALSVGIGFGLQSIVNNFVSGLVLLLERPIRIGDRIIVGEVEGYIKRIQIRSTVIRTLERTDVIIPNADLVTGQVTNLVYQDTRTRISIYVGVAYGSDVQLVKQVLYDIALKHPEVICDEQVKPKILFKEFADSSLVFELRVIISDVNNRAEIASDLHFVINSAFAKHGIEMPFPQRDIHIKNDPEQGSPE